MNIFNAAEHAISLADQFSTPIYVYDEKTLRKNASKCLSFPNAYGLVVRYAMKACPTSAILKLFDSYGIHFDASSVYEVERALLSNISPDKISLSTQELPIDFETVIRKGIKFNATSLNQLERYGESFPHSKVGVRFNPGIGSGHSGKTTVGGVNSSFGIWHEYSGEVAKIAAKYGLTIERIHIHIGSGSEPSKWLEAAISSLKFVRLFETVTSLDLGGGYRVGRMPGEPTTDIEDWGSKLREEIVKFNNETGRELRIEIEPGTFLVANAGALLCRVQDVVDTGVNGRKFIKLDTGMTDIIRPSLYGSQHPIEIVKRRKADQEEKGKNAEFNETDDYVVVGHCCESGDILSCSPNDPETFVTRKLLKAEIGDLCVIAGTGAYCSAMSAKNYNSFPESAEVLIKENGQPKLIRKRQLVEQMIQNEIFDE